MVDLFEGAKPDLTWMTHPPQLFGLTLKLLRIGISSSIIHDMTLNQSIPVRNRLEPGALLENGNLYFNVTDIPAWLTQCPSR